jgi:hypothetical protein
MRMTAAAGTLTQAWLAERGLADPPLTQARRSPRTEGNRDALRIVISGEPRPWRKQWRVDSYGRRAL